MDDASVGMSPTTLAARSMGVMWQPREYHGRDYYPNTNVLQGLSPITRVKTLAERAAWARTQLGLTQDQLAQRAKVSQGTIGNMESGTRKKPRDLLTIAEALGVRPEWLESGRAPIERAPSQGDSSPTPAFPGVYQDVSQAMPIVPLPRYMWGDLVNADLTKPFELEVSDDALGPDIFRGCIARFDPSWPPEPGWPVLVRDRDGAHYLRDYQRGIGDRWQAVPRLARGFDKLDSQDDGLVIVAVMIGYDRPRPGG